MTAFQAEGAGGGFAAVFIMPPSAAPFHHFVVPLPPDERWEASLKVVVSFPPTKWDRQGLRQRSSPPCYLPTPFPGVGGERSETEGGGWMGRSAARVHRAQRGRFLRWMGLGPRVLKFDGLSGRGWWWRLRRKFYKAAFGGLTVPLHPYTTGFDGNVLLFHVTCPPPVLGRTQRDLPVFPRSETRL